MSVFGIFTPFQWIVLSLLALIFVAVVVIIVMLRRQKNANKERHDDLLAWHNHTAEVAAKLTEKLNPQVDLEGAVKEILGEVGARASIVTAQLTERQQATLTAFTQAAGRELEEFRRHAQRAIDQVPPKYTFRQPPHGLPAMAPQQSRALPSSVPQQAIGQAAPVWQAPGNGAQASGQATGYFAHNGNVATGGNGLALIEEPQAEADDLGFSAGYDDATPEEMAPEVGQEFEPKANFGPEQATTPDLEPEQEPEPAPEPVSEVAEPEHMLHTGDDMATDPPQADKEPAMWNAEATLSRLPIAATVFAEINSKFPKTDTGMEPVKPAEPEPTAPDLAATDQHGASGTSE